MSALRLHHYVLFVLLLLVLVLGSQMEAVWTRKNYDVLPGMVYSIPMNGQSERWRAVAELRGENVAHGTVALADTVRGAQDPTARLSDSARATMLPALLARGRDQYATFCLPCHGADGRGNGSVVARGFPPPPSLLGESALALADSAIYGIIERGRANMPAHASQVVPVDRWNIIRHIRSMQTASTAAKGGA
jgi:mono/diheme cytochrome c family protein